MPGSIRARSRPVGQYARFNYQPDPLRVVVAVENVGYVAALAKSKDCQGP